MEGERAGVGGRRSEVSALWTRLEDEEVVGDFMGILSAWVVGKGVSIGVLI